MFTATRVSSVLAVSAALIASVALPANAAETVDTTLTVTVPTGGLHISAPGLAAFGTVTPGLAATKTATITDVTVTDTRGGLAKQWVASVASTDFVGATPTNTFSAGAVTYLPGVATPDGTLADGTLTVAVALPGGPFALTRAPQTAQSTTSVLGNNTVKWSPTLTLTVPENAVPDTYKATLTHSVL